MDEIDRIIEYDLVAITKASDAETATAVLLQVGSLGNVRTDQPRGVRPRRVRWILAKSG